MRNLATKNTNDFCVTDTGEAFISQRKAAELLGVDEKSIRNFLKSAHNHDVNQGVSAENLQKSATHYALFSKAANDTARNFAAKLMEAGAKAYIYHQCGYVADARPATPESYIEALEALLVVEREKLILKEKNDALSTALDNEFGYCSILRAAIFLGVSETIFNWRPLKAESILIGYPAKKVPSPRYGYQNLYPLQAFRTCYPEFDFEGLRPDPDQPETLIID